MSTHDSDSYPTAEPFDWEAIARYLAGESTPDEARGVRAWLDARPDRAELVAALGRSFDRLAADDGGDVDVEGALARVHARMREPATSTLTVERGGRGATVPRFAPRLPAARPVWRRPATWLAAAAAVAIAAVGVSRMKPHAGPAVAVTSYASAIGARDSVRLPDGTRVMLGPSSRLDVDARYGAERRDVTLHGEAYFDVVHDAARPFVVHAGDAAIEDIGTAFTVRSDSATGVRIAVTAGRVRVSHPDGATVVLAAGDAATLDSALHVARGAASPSEELAFTRGQLVFREAPLTQVAAELHRWYGLELRLEDPALATRRLTASFEKETPDQVLAVIGAALGTPVERHGDTVVIRPAARGARGVGGRASGVR